MAEIHRMRRNTLYIYCGQFIFFLPPSYHFFSLLFSCIHQTPIRRTFINDFQPTWSLVVPTRFPLFTASLLTLMWLDVFQTSNPIPQFPFLLVPRPVSWYWVSNLLNSLFDTLGFAFLSFAVYFSVPHVSTWFFCYYKYHNCSCLPGLHSPPHTCESWTELIYAFIAKWLIL